MEENKSIYLMIGCCFLFVCFGLARLLCTFCITFTLFSWLRTPNSTGSRWALETSESMQLEPDPLLDNLHLQTVTLHSHSSSSASSERWSKRHCMKMSRVKYQFMILPLACLRLLYLTTSIILGELGSVGAVGGGGIVLFHIYIYRDMTGTMTCLGNGGKMREEEQGNVATWLAFWTLLCPVLCLLPKIETHSTSSHSSFGSLCVRLETDKGSCPFGVSSNTEPFPNTPLSQLLHAELGHSKVREFWGVATRSAVCTRA